MISLVIVNYNQGRYLGKAIASILEQTRQDWELLIWDDGSTDNSVAIARKYEEQDKRIRVIATTHQGIAKARKQSIEATRGEYIGWIDGDDWIADTALEETAKVLDRNAAIGMVYTDYYDVNSQGKILGKGKRCNIPYSPQRLLVDFMTFHFRLFRREVYQQTGGINTSLKYAYDYDLCLRLSEVTDFARIKKPLYYYRHHRHSISYSKREKQTQCSQQAINEALQRRGLADNYILTVEDNCFYLTRKQNKVPLIKGDLGGSNLLKTAATLITVLPFTAALSLQPVSAQKIIPNNDGTMTVITKDGSTFNIDGGSLSGDGKNLFHSFREFGLDAGQIANFLSNPNIQNILGRINGGNPSIINGLIQVSGGNSNLFLMNPSGIIFGNNASLNVPGDFTATTATGIGFGNGWFNAVGANDYLNLVGNPNSFNFANSESGVIINSGDLAVTNDSNISLTGGTVINTGTIETEGGNITVAAVPNTNRVRISQEGQLLSIEVAVPQDANGQPLAVRAMDLPNLLRGLPVDIDTGLAVAANDDVTVANSSTVIPNEPGTTIISGTVDVSDIQSGGVGGEAQLLGDKVGLIGANVDASGDAGGGTVLAGGEYQGQGTLPTAEVTVVDSDSIIKADALQTGDGGEVIVWADKATRFQGNITARGGQVSGNGGFVETSGKEYLEATGTVDASAPQGQGGTWLLDPNNITIEDVSNSNIVGEPDPDLGPDFTTTNDDAKLNPESIEESLDSGTDVTVTTGTAGENSDAGNIFIESSIEKTGGTDASLTLEANNSIIFRNGADITSTSDRLNITLNANRDSIGRGTIRINSGPSDPPNPTEIKSNGGNIVFGGGSDPTTNPAVGTPSLTNGISLDNAKIDSAGGNITLTGTGYGSALDIGLSNNTELTSGDGNISLTGIDNGIGIDNTSITTNNNLTLTGDRISLTNGTTLQGANVTLQPQTINFGIVIEPPSGVVFDNTLEITQSELDAITANSLTIGRTDGTGRIRVFSDLQLVQDTEFVTSGDFSAQNIDAKGQNISIQANNVTTGNIDTSGLDATDSLPGLGDDGGDGGQVNITALDGIDIFDINTQGGDGLSSANGNGGDGGQITLIGSNITVGDINSNSGEGRNSSDTNEANGGEVTLNADGSNIFVGNIEANGGTSLREVDGELLLVGLDGEMDLSAPSTITTGSLESPSGSSFLESETITINGVLDSGIVTLRADEIDLNDSISASNIFISTQSFNRNITINTTEDNPNSLDISPTELDAINNSSTLIISLQTDEGALTIENDVVFFVPVRLQAENIQVNSLLEGRGDASITLIGSGATTTLNADITTQGQPILIDDNVILGANVNLNTTDEGAAGANITIDGTVNNVSLPDPSPSPNDLTLNAGTGDTNITGAIGDTNPIGNLIANNDSGTFSAQDITVDGSNISVEAASITTGDIETSDTSGDSGGAVELTATAGSVVTGNITTAGDNSYSYSYSDGGNGGQVTITASESITTQSIDTSGINQSGSGYGSFAAGAGGEVELTATNGSIVTGDVTTTGGDSYYSNGNNAGQVTMTASESITTQFINASGGDSGLGGEGGAGGAGGEVELTVTNGSIVTGDVATTGGDSSSGNGGDGNNVTITASESITTQSINTSGGDGNTTDGSKGDVSLSAPEGITTTYIDGGNIDIDSNGAEDNTDGLFVATDVIDDGGISVRGTNVTIEHGGGNRDPRIPFEVSNSTTNNGTAGSIFSSAENVDNATFPESFTSEGETIQILTPGVVALPIVAADDGTGSVVTAQTDGVTFNLTGGTLSGDGQNLFHSYTRFDLPQSDQIANFIANDSLENILARVTSGDASDIRGTIQVTGGNPNLFLLNPAGIIFGATAQINVPAAFTASTGNGVRFGDNWFSASGAFNASVLNGTPDAIAFTSNNPGSIINNANIVDSETNNVGELNFIGGTVVNSGDISSDGFAAVALNEGQSIVNLLDFSISSTEGVTNLPNTFDPDILTVANLISLISEDSISVPNGDDTALDIQNPINSNGQDINLVGNSNNAEGVLITTNINAAGGNINITGTSVAEDGVFINGQVTTTNEGNINITGTSDREIGILTLGTEATSGTEGEGTPEVRTIISTANGEINLTGTSTEGTGVNTQITNITSTEGAINITGTSGSNDGMLIDNTNISTNSNVTLTADEIDISETSTLRGNNSVTLQPETPELDITVASTTQSDNVLDITEAELNTIQTGTNSVIIGREDGSGTITVAGEIGNGTFDISSDLTLRTPASNGVILVDNTIFLNDSQNLTLDAGTSININQDIFTDNGAITITSRGNIDINTEDVNSDGGTITITSEGGTISTNQTIIDSSSDISGGNVNITATGDIQVGIINSGTFNDLSGEANGGNITINSTGGGINAFAPISFGEEFSPISFGFLFSGADTEKQNGGIITLQATGDINTGYIYSGSFGTGTGGAISVTSDNGNINTTVGANRPSDIGSITDFPVELTPEVLEIIFAGVSSLSLNNGGDITFTANNGDITSSDITATSNVATGGEVTLTTSSGSITPKNITTNNNDINLNGAVTLNQDTTITSNGTGNINFTGTIDGTNNLILNAGSSNINLQGNVGNETALGNLNATGTIRTSGRDLNVTANSISTQDITTQNEEGGKGGNVELRSIEGAISTGDINSSGGNIDLNSASTIATEAIDSSGTGVGGDVTLNSGDNSNIRVGTIRADGTENGGEIKVNADSDNPGLFVANDSFRLNGEGEPISIFTNSSSDEAIIIKHGGRGVVPFEVANPEFEGQDNVNGTVGAIIGGEDSQIDEGSFPFTERRGNIGIISVDDGEREEAINRVINRSEGDTDEVLKSDSQQALAESPLMIASIPEARETLLNIAKEAAQKPALVYINFTSAQIPTAADNSEEYFRRAENCLTEEFKQALNLQVTDTAPIICLAAQPTDQLEVLVVTPEGEPIYFKSNVTREQVEEQAEELYLEVSDNEIGWREPSQQLYQWLIADIEEELAIREIDNLLFVLPPKLRSLPIAALYDGNNREFLVQKGYNVGLAPSINLMNTIYKKDIQDAEVLALGASDFTEEQQQVPLNAVEVELNEIIALRGGNDPILNEQFTLPNLQNTLDKNSLSIVHLATHANFDTDSIDNIYIQLYDQKLTLDQLKALNIKVGDTERELLVLSACRSAFGNLDAELGFAGLAIKLGFKTAIGSLWYVEDVTNPGLMAEFYHQLKTNPFKAEALRLAQVAMIEGKMTIDLEARQIITSWGETIDLPEKSVTALTEQGIDRINLSHPYYWAPFTVIGSPW